ncbi:MAG: carboxypeptidase regulatory-like domain-containing protein [Candidatus Woesearchaeota archaeon]|nr:MAG: carboxypeptidase regulatory-like domain-containing protein [Candidatus Woesearchaeota archaeon]
MRELRFLLVMISLLVVVSGAFGALLSVYKEVTVDAYSPYGPPQYYSCENTTSLDPNLYDANDHAYDACGASIFQGGIGAGHAAEVCSSCFTCGYDDNICPEDYSEDGSAFITCGKCPDPDCLTTSLTGTVYSDLNEPLPHAYVFFHLPQKGYDSHFVVETDENGHWTSADVQSESHFGSTRYGVPRGEYLISAVAIGYDAEFVEANVTDSPQVIDFHLHNATCHADCTAFRYPGRPARCSAACDGFVDPEDNTLTCDFNTGTFEGQTYDAKDYCDQKVNATDVIVATSTTHSYIVNCCEGTFRSELRPEQEITPSSNPFGIKDLVVLEVPLRMNNQQVFMKILVWKPQ